MKSSCININIIPPINILQEFFLHNIYMYKMLQILCSSFCGIVTIGVGRPGVIRGPELGEGHPVPQLGPAVAPGQRVGLGVGA